MMSAITLPDSTIFAAWMNPSIIGAAIAIAFIASAETLLSAAAVDRMHDGVRTNYNKELSAQGIGNLLCGVVGALPMTGVIVRSSANVQAGATTRLSTILHGVWILAFVALLPWLMREIPMAALGAVLVVTGWRLVNLHHATHLFKHYGLLPAAIWAITLILVVAEDLLTGVLVGLALSMLELIPNLKRLRLKVDHPTDDTVHTIRLAGSATFVTLPKLSDTLEAAPQGAPVRLELSKLAAMDHSCAELLKDWLQRRRASGNAVELRGATGNVASLAAA
jgi:MFS superfamily sulfate permease-like transporter